MLVAQGAEPSRLFARRRRAGRARAWGAVRERRVVRGRRTPSWSARATPGAASCCRATSAGRSRDRRLGAGARRRQAGTARGLLGHGGEIAEYVRRVGIRSTVAVPIVVAGRMWGAMVVSATESALPADTEVRLTDFTELLATAIANSEAQEEVTRLAEEQAALRRVATLVAHDVAPDELFRAVRGRSAGCSAPTWRASPRYDPDDVVTHFSAWSTAARLRTWRGACRGTPPACRRRFATPAAGAGRRVA